MEDIAVIVLAGGESSRMNFPKPWLIFDKDTTFLESAVNRYSWIGFKKIVISLNKQFFLTPYLGVINNLKSTATFVKNLYPEKGRLYSLYIALKSIDNVAFVLIHNVDSPYIDKKVIKQLYNERLTEGTTIPSFNRKTGHPIIISNVVINEIINNYTKYATLKEVINKFDKKYVEVNDSSILININTPEELKKYKNG